MLNRIAKILYMCLVVIFLVQNFSYSLEPKLSVEVSSQKYLSTDKIEQIFKSNIGKNTSVFYTKVPRGLVVSFDSDIFFENDSVDLKDSSKDLLNKISILITEIGKPCVIEGNSTERNLRGSFINSNMELTIERAQNIAQYIVQTKLVSHSQIYAIGFGELMPFRDNVEYCDDMDNRIDFVIINYEKYQR